VFDASRYPLAQESAYRPEDASIEVFRRVCRSRGISRAVLVHPSVYGADHRSYEDTLAANSDWLRGVAVVYPDEATTSDAQIERWNRLGTTGTRINRLFPSAPSQPERIVDRVKSLGWHVQVLTDITEDIALVKQISERNVPVVVDHFGHHSCRSLVASKGFKDLLSLMREGIAWVKFSAPYRVGARGSTWSTIQPVVDQLLQANAQRVVWGSDWPHPPNYKNPFSEPKEEDIGASIALWLPDAQLRRQVMETNPRSLYGVS
jgi:predicted TIM-barrel fold metal-dependent hydrolase